MSLHYQNPDDTDFSDDNYDDTPSSNNQDKERPVRVKKHIIKEKKESPRNSRDGNFHRKLTPMPKEKYKKNSWLDSEEE
jgi:hypothetical protein